MRLPALAPGTCEVWLGGNADKTGSYWLRMYGNAEEAETEHGHLGNRGGAPARSGVGDRKGARGAGRLEESQKPGLRAPQADATAVLYRGLPRADEGVKPLNRPQALVLGRYDDAGRLRAVGRTVALRPEQARLVAESLAAAESGHPWTGVRFAAAWGSRDVLDAVLVHPEAVAEISADRSVDRGGVFRHPLRFQRLRLDVVPEDVPGFGRGWAAAAG